MSAPQNWRTPKPLFAGLNAEVLGHYGRGFELDLACDEANALCPLRVPDSFTLTTWRGPICWCNPPWNDVERWLSRALDDGAMGCFLLPARMDRAWFRRALKEAFVEVFSGRVAFDDPLLQGRTQPREGGILVWLDGRRGIETQKFRHPVTGLWIP